jgi:hypothetical protein
MTISNEGKVQIYFSEELVIPTNATLEVNRTVLKLELITKNLAYNKY